MVRLPIELMIATAVVVRAHLSHNHITSVFITMQYIGPTGGKYAADKPVQLYGTPYEERIERALQAEAEAASSRRRHLDLNDTNG